MMTKIQRSEILTQLDLCKTIHLQGDIDQGTSILNILARDTDLGSVEICALQSALMGAMRLIDNAATELEERLNFITAQLEQGGKQ